MPKALSHRACFDSRAACVFLGTMLPGCKCTVIAVRCALLDRGTCARAFELSHGPYPGVYQSLACAVSRNWNAPRRNPRLFQNLEPCVRGGGGV